MTTDADKFAVSVTGTPHFAELDALRGLAALSVVFLHMSWNSPFLNLGYVHNSYLMVDLFFVLSGFVISGAYYNRMGSAGRIGGFMWLRFWRIYPVHLLFLFMALLIKTAKYAVAEKGLHPAFGPDDGVGVFANILLLQGFNIGSGYNLPSWSISAEFFAYLLFAFIAWRMTARRGLVAASFLIMTASLAALASRGPMAVTQTFDFGFLRCFGGFFCGALTYAAYDRLHPRWKTHRTIGYAGAACLVLFALYLSLKGKGWTDFLIYPLSAITILCISLAPRTRALDLLRLPQVRWLGAISYSLYMCHYWIEYIVANLLRAVFHVPYMAIGVDKDVQILATTYAQGMVGTAIVLVVALLVAEASFRWVEVPLRAWSRKQVPFGRVFRRV